MRKLEAIEIAEGALLADVAVVFELIAAFLPVGASFFRLLIFITFSILVLRRGLYVGMMGLAVALFILAVTIGPQYVITMLLQGTGGMFLGFTMRRRFHHIPTILLGALTGALASYALLLLLTWLTGVPISEFVRTLRQTWNAVLPLIGSIMGNAGLGVWWKTSMYPQVLALSTAAFTYWWATFYLLLCLALIPVVAAIYIATNFFVRLLGYDVRPFPGGRLGVWLHRFRRRLLKLAIRWGLLKRLWGRA